MNKNTVGSLFAGIGGIDIGFEQAGFEPVWANEYNKHACETFRLNNKSVKMIEKDIHNLSVNDIFPVDIITAGFPCQAFSIAGYQEGFKDKKGRGNLFFETARIIKELQPKAYLLENVKNLQAHDKGRTLKIIKGTIVNELNYSFIPFVLNSKDFGDVPQTRERIYIVGFKGESSVTYDYDNKRVKNDNFKTTLFEIPEPIRLKKKIHDCINSTKQDDYFYYTNNSKYFQIFSKEITNRDTVYQWRRVYVRENKSNLCPTLTAYMGTGGHNVPIIKDDYGIRKITP